MAAPTPPTGNAIAIAPATRYRVPTIAGNMPPPSRPSARGGRGQKFPTDGGQAVDDNIAEDDGKCRKHHGEGHIEQGKGHCLLVPWLNAGRNIPPEGTDKSEHTGRRRGGDSHGHSKEKDCRDRYADLPPVAGEECCKPAGPVAGAGLLCTDATENLHGREIDNKRDEKQKQGNPKEGMVVGAADGRLSHLNAQRAGQGPYGREDIIQRIRDDGGGIAGDHQNRHRLADRPSDTKDECCGDAGESGGNNDL